MAIFPDMAETSSVIVDEKAISDYNNGRKKEDAL